MSYRKQRFILSVVSSTNQSLQLVNKLPRKLEKSVIYFSIWLHFSPKRHARPLVVSQRVLPPVRRVNVHCTLFILTFLLLSSQTSRKHENEASVSAGSYKHRAKYAVYFNESCKDAPLESEANKEINKDLKTLTVCGT